MIAPPYSSEFVQLFSPIVKNKEITGRLRKSEGSYNVSSFIGKSMK
jgi:negative elongation factor C/D